jgi:hypothetical protein
MLQGTKRYEKIQNILKRYPGLKKVTNLIFLLKKAIKKIVPKSDKYKKKLIYKT